MFHVDFDQSESTTVDIKKLVLLCMTHAACTPTQYITTVYLSYNHNAKFL